MTKPNHTHKRFWISWYSPLSPERIPFKSWVTGQRGFSESDKGFAIIYVGDIHAESEEKAFEQVTSVFPDYEYRFCEEKAEDWKPSDRFQQTD